MGSNPLGGTMAKTETRKRILLFKTTIKDCEVQTFRSGGKGGQNQNKRDTGVRIIHRPSGAVGESREHRTQLENKRAAFTRMGESAKFKTWARLKAAGMQAPEEIVEELMKDENLEFEYGDIVGGKFIPVEEQDGR